MGKWKQQFSIGYFLVALILLFALQSFFASPPSRNDQLQPVQILGEKGARVQRCHRGKDNSRRN
jgi:hypothetical protein